MILTGVPNGGAQIRRTLPRNAVPALGGLIRPAVASCPAAWPRLTTAVDIRSARCGRSVGDVGGPVSGVADAATEVGIGCRSDRFQLRTGSLTSYVNRTASYTTWATL